MNINQLFEQFVGGAGGAPSNTGQNPSQPQPARAAQMLGKLAQSPAAGLAGGLAAGGVLGALIGNKKMRKKAGKLAGGAVGYGGSAVLGALALKAYQNWQSAPATESPPPGRSNGSVPAVAAREAFDPANTTDASGQPMQLALIKAMIAAANADGHIDGEEQATVFEAVDNLDLDPAAKGLIFDVMRDPPTLQEVAGFAAGIEQAGEIYLASRLAIDPDEPSERRYLNDLASAMALPDGYVREIEMQVEAGNARTVN